jgi:hypothetical protein
VKRNITELVAQLKREGLSKRIVGVHLGGYHDHQISTRHMDYSKPAVEGFKAWQRKCYGKVRWDAPPQYFNRIVKEAQGYAPVAGGLQVNMNGRFLSIHSLKLGKYDFLLPFPCKVQDLKSGEIRPLSRTLPLELKAGDTCWFRFID